MIMCIWVIIAISAHISLSIPSTVELIFENHVMKNILKKDLSAEGRSISFFESDYLPSEPDNGDLHDKCKTNIAAVYEDLVYAIAEHKGCNIENISGVSVDRLNAQILSADEYAKTRVSSSKGRAKAQKNCTLAKIGGYCPAYLMYAECVFFNYVSSNGANKKVTIPELPHMDEVIHPLFLKFIESNVNVYSPLLVETVFNLCRLVNKVCGTIHPQFESSRTFRLKHICGVFDVFTPLEGFDALYDATLAKEELEDLVLKERKLSKEYYLYGTSSDVEFSPLGVPHDTYINSATSLEKHFANACEKRCEYHKRMKTLTSNWKKLSSAGYSRQVILCAKHTLLCPSCDVCREMGVTVTIL